jgi:aspartate/tyrosine/aromatic aminotransferase
LFSSCATSSISEWIRLKNAPLDENHETAHAHDSDPSPLKVNLGRGEYKDDNGKDVFLKCVRKAEEKIFANPKRNHNYLPFYGLPEFVDATAMFAFGSDCPALAAKQRHWCFKDRRRVFDIKYARRLSPSYLPA